MLDKLFMTILDLTKTGSIVILAVILIRFLLKKSPKVISYALWAVVLFRLLCPVTLELPVSVMPELPSVQESYVFTDIQVSPGEVDKAAYKAIDNRFTALKGTEDQLVPISTPDFVGKTVYVKMKWTDIAMILGKYIWLVGVAAMMVYGIVSYAKLRRRTAVKIPLGDGVYLADEISFPFVLGILKPKIYLPSAMDAQERVYVLNHERHHIRRLDPLWKALGFLTLTLHWFNPLVWVAFILAGKDMEMSCDEAVICRMGEQVRADYAQSLASLATDRHTFTGMPLAFAEGDPKMRIHNLAKWKKPAVWVVIAAVVISVILAVCLLVDPARTDTKPTATTDSADTQTVDIRPLPPENPGNSLIEYDPDRSIYIGSEHVYMDYYIGFTKLPSFYFYIFSRQPLDPDSISVSFPVDLPFVVTVNDQKVEKKTMAMVEKTGGLGYASMPYHVYQAYRGADDVYADFERLRSDDLAEFHVCAVVVGLFNIRNLSETVTLETLDVTIGDEVYEAKLGRVRLLPAEEFPADYPVVMGKGIAGNNCQLYNDGLSDLANVFEVNNAQEDMTITNLYMVEEESRILDISVLLKSDGMNVQMQWDGKTPIHVYKGDSIEIDVIIKNPHTAKLLNYVMCHTVTEFLNSNNEKVCAVNTQVGSEGRNLHEHYAIIFDGLNLEPYYRNPVYQLTFPWIYKIWENQ